MVRLSSRQVEARRRCGTHLRPSEPENAARVDTTQRPLGSVMRALVFSLSLGIAALTAAPGGAQERDPGWTTYAIAESGTSVDYPSHIFSVAERPGTDLGQ